MPSTLGTARLCFVQSESVRRQRVPSPLDHAALHRWVHGPTAHWLALAAASAGCRGGVSMPRRLTPPDWRMLRSPSMGLL